MSEVTQYSVRDGVAVITTEFSWDVDVDRKFDEVVREVNILRPTLPAGVVRVETEKASTALTNIVQMAFVGERASYRELEGAAIDLRERRMRHGHAGYTNQEADSCSELHASP
jgi:multidrug efflux pump subunit AcrB